MHSLTCTLPLQDSGLEKLEYRSINFEADILPNEGYFQTR
jgi:hypothetical protein